MYFLRYCMIVMSILELVNCVKEVLKLPDTYRDVFLPGSSGKTILGTTRATCWARGGICVRINECRSLNMDTTVPGCSRGMRVCCKIHKFGPPTVGSVRNGPDIVVLPSDKDAFDQDLVNEVATVNQNILQLLFRS